MKRLLIAFLTGFLAVGFCARAEDSCGAPPQESAPQKVVKAERAAEGVGVEPASPKPAPEPERGNGAEKRQARGDRKVLAQATGETRQVAERKGRGKQVVAFWIILPDEAR